MVNYEQGNIVKAVVSGITKYGIFVNLDNNYSGLIHISQISTKYVKDPNLFVEEAEIINVEVLEVDEINKHLKLSIKNIQYKKNGPKRKIIIETSQGFKTLASKLPIWIEENLKKSKNKINSLDK